MPRFFGELLLRPDTYLYNASDTISSTRCRRRSVICSCCYLRFCALPFLSAGDLWFSATFTYIKTPGCRYALPWAMCFCAYNACWSMYFLRSSSQRNQEQCHFGYSKLYTLFIQVSHGLNIRHLSPLIFIYLLFTTCEV